MPKTITLQDSTVADLLKVLEPTSAPIPTTPVPSTPVKKYLALDCINWSSDGNPVLTPGVNLSFQDASEFTYFVLPVDVSYNLYGGDIVQETNFVNNVHGAGKKATFSIAGGTQDITIITNAVNDKTALVNSINSHIKQFKYDGVVIDIEGTAIDPQKMVDFITLLRIVVGADKIIGVNTQGYQLNTVWSKIGQAMNSITWIGPMLYDSGSYNKQQMISWINQWLAKVPKEKLIMGVAVNYDPSGTGLNTTQFGEMCDVINSENLMGFSIWENTLYTDPWIQVRRSKLPNI